MQASFARFTMQPAGGSGCDVPYFYNLGKALSRLGNALIGGHPDHSLSRRIGISILRRGFWAHVPMPHRIRDHFIRSALGS